MLYQSQLGLTKFIADIEISSKRMHFNVICGIRVLQLQYNQ